MTTSVIDLIQPGSRRHFEYHCLESHNSGDAQLWYRSHQCVTVFECVNAEFGDMDFEERCYQGCPLVYRIRFADGHEGDAFEDELLLDRASYCRPDPPAPLA